MELRNVGRTVALGSVAALVFSTCSGSATPSPSAAASAAASSAAAGITVGYLPKDIVNQYFAAAKTGIDKAVTELGGAPVTTVGPNVATDPAGQVPFTPTIPDTTR